jgi:hypothetical protein
MEALRAAFQRLGHAAQQTAASMAEAFAASRGDRVSFTAPPGPTIGRKRRARRARGRRIEARRNPFRQDPPYVGGWIIKGRINA